MMRSFILTAFCAVGLAPVWAQEIRQELGVDARVDYASLARFGPWDDRNYQLTQEDLQLLAPNEEELADPIPAFFRVELRRQIPHLRRQGPAQYPRAAVPLFYIRYGGLMIDGSIEGHDEDEEGIPVPVNNEIQLNQVLGANEVTVEINPVFPDQVIAGSNNNGGQEMYYSDDGGQTWTIQGTLPSTCCDPTVGWSSDGTIAYAAALSSAIGVNFYRSTNFGHTWSPALVITPSGSDKEWLHVDVSPTSPHIDNVYLTYHNGNVMQFARSLDLGVSFQTPMAFPGAPRGIGSDITTDSPGNIYYFYGAFNEQQIIMLKSTDGGQNFDPPVVVASTNGSFDFPIPSMESRRAWIYAAADSDRSGGPFDGSIYTAWTDTIDPETNDPNQNHTQVIVAYSRDGGATWNTSIPHSTADGDTVDRYNQWMTVDTNGTVHVVYYDTRHSTNRTGVDLYYTFSTDGGVTWNEPARISSETSANLSDGQEWGDYNGISVFQEKIISTWTDNRDGPPNMKDVYAADALNVTAEPTFLMTGDLLNQTICRPADLDDITLDISAILGFSNPVTLSFVSLPSGFSGDFSVNPVNPPGQTVVSLSADGTVAAGDYMIEVNGTATGTTDRQLVINVTVQTGTFAGPTLVSPADGEPNGGINNVPLVWDPVMGATEYRVQVSETSDFAAPVIDTTTADSNFLATGMMEGLTYYWRIATANACGEGAFSGAFSFVANAELVFLVDQDDNDPDVLSFFVDTLTNLGVSFKTFDVTSQGLPTNLEFGGHPIIIWFSGDRFSGPDDAASAELATFIDNGGKLFLSSQDYLWPYRPDVPPFGMNYLGVGSVTNDGGDYTSVTPDPGGIFNGLGTMNLNYLHTDYSDSITANGNGTLALAGNNGNGAAVTTDNTVFFAFPFTALANNGTEGGSSTDAEAVLNAILQHFTNSDCFGSDLEALADKDGSECPPAFTLNAQGMNGAGGYTYSWQPAGLLDDPTSATPSGTVTETTIFTVTITDSEGCTAIDTVTVYPTIPEFDGTAASTWLTSGVMGLTDIDGNGIINTLDFTSYVNCTPL